MATRSVLPSMRDHGIQMLRPSMQTNGYRAPSLTPAPSILAKRTISEDCTQAPESERPRKYHCLQKEAKRRAIPRLDHLKKPVAGLSTGQSIAMQFTRGLKPLNPLPIPGDTNSDLAPPPLPPPPHISDLESGYEAGWEHASSILPFVSREPAFDPTSNLRPIEYDPWHDPTMHPFWENKEGNHNLQHASGETSRPNKAGGSQQSPAKDLVYKCFLCPERPQMNYKASFKRHIQNKHYPTQYYRCPDCDVDPVETLFTRQDRLQNHMIHEHGYRLRNEEIKRITLAVDPPLKCALCASTTRSWNEHFECLCRHCLVSKAENGDGDHSEGDDGEEGDDGDDGELATREFTHNADSDHRG